MSSTVRRPMLRGQQLIAGLWLPAERFAEDARVALLLEHWQPGATAWRFESGDLLRWQHPQRLHCETLSGWPLIVQGQTLCSAVLEDDERASLPAASLWLVRQARVQALHLADACPLHPGKWLDIAEYALLDTYDCSPALETPALQPLQVDSDVRQILGAVVKPPSSERAQVMAALAERQPTAESPTQAGRSSAAKPKPAFVVRIAAGVVLMAVAGLASVWLPRPPPLSTAIAGVTEAGSSLPWLLVLPAIIVIGLMLRDILAQSKKPLKKTTSAPQATAPAIAARRQWRRFTPGFIDRWLTRLATASRLNTLFGKRQAAYLQRMLELFEQGELNEALRHALPLGDSGGGGPQAFGTPQRRTELELRQQRSAGRSINLPNAFNEHLRQVYRKSFTRLDREGRIDEAVFVLAELLGVRQEALDYLERHQRFAQSAELALAWDMPAALIVRLLCLADDWQRALLVARRDGAFADAVTALHEKWPEPAARLRVEWADYLAGRGRWMEAVDVIWSLTDQRPRAIQWLLDAEAAGGDLEGAALAKRAVLLPDTVALYEPRLLEIRDDPALQAERSTLAAELLRYKNQATPACRLIAAALVGACVEDRRLMHDQIRTLIKLGNDPWLTTDIPTLQYRPSEPLVWRAEETLEWQAPVAGLRAVVDAQMLQDRRILVALGESGVWLLSSLGQVLARFAVPAEHLVLADGGVMALALVRRDSVWRVSKLDFTHRTARDLGVLVMDQFARSFDGTGWMIAKGNHVRVVDVDRDFVTLWHVDELPGTVAGIFRESQFEMFLLAEPDGTLQRWRYKRPDRRLQARDPVSRCFEEGAAVAYSAEGEVLDYWVAVTAQNAVLHIHWDDQRASYPLPDWDSASQQPVQLDAQDQWWLVVYPCVGGHQQIRLIRRDNGLCQVTVGWPGAEPVQFRAAGLNWTVFDAQGRLMGFGKYSSQPICISLH